jgi:hypothetical protein
LCQLLRKEGVACSAQEIPTAVNLGFLDRHIIYIHILFPRFFILFPSF